MLFVLKLIARNALRHKLRTVLTIIGLLVAVTAYGLLQTVVDAWYAGARAASNTRLITRNSISLVFPLPLNYEARIRAIEGVSAETLVSRIKSGGHRDARYLEGPDELASTIGAIARPGDFVVLLGAGSITYWAAALPKELAGISGITA